MKRATYLVRHRRFLLSVCVVLVLDVAFPHFSVHASSLPGVSLNADSIAPRAIEQQTGETVARDYAQAWEDLSEAMDGNRTDLLNDYFTGEAKDRLSHRIAEQQKTGLRTRYVDHGHHVKAVFYSLDGGEMQLEDESQIEVRVMDGPKTIHATNSTQKYLVLMTPGADRWYVRSLELVPDNAFRGTVLHEK